MATFFVDWPMSFGVGMLFGLVAARGGDPAGRWFRTRAFRFGLAYETLGFLSISVWLYARFPDWMWMFWVPADQPAALVASSFALYVVAYAAGFSSATALESARRNAGVALAVAVGAGLTAFEVATRDRLFTDGSFGTLPAPQTADLLTLAAVGAASIALMGLLLVRLWAERRRADGIL